jgi:hypothetical protein
MVRRYFFNARNEKHYNKKWRKQMGGYIGLESDKSEFIRGQQTPQHAVQEAIDGLNAATTRLDNLIREMQGNCECKN